jgi:two-component system OmpR family sensor kinase
MGTLARARAIWPRTLGGRLVAGALALVLVIVLSVGAATYLALRSFLVDRLDQQLQGTVDQGNVNGIWQDYTGTDAGRFRLPQSVWVEFVEDDGSTVIPASTASVTAVNLPTATQVNLANDLGNPYSVTTSSGEHLRMLAIRVASGGSGSSPGGSTTAFSGVAFIGLSTGDVTDTLNRLLILELAIGACVAVLAVGATMYGVRASLRPLHRVTNTARKVAAELSPDGHGLDLRVPDLGPHASETEVGQLAGSVNTLLEAVETQFAERRASEDRMRQFLADASHELRTPLTSIRGYAELARLRRMSANGSSDATSADELDRIETEGTRMTRLIDDLLLLARTDQGAVPQFGAIEIKDLVDDVVDATRAAHLDRTITIDTVADATVFGDRDQLVRVLRNLITNAAVHTDPSGPIEVAVRNDDGQVLVTVKDAGPGLSADDAAHVFERFWRADKARTRVRGGSGLGLSIVETVVAAHDGSLRFDSSVAGGSTVTVTLPRLRETISH